jgi:integrase
MRGTPALMAALIYGGGLRVSECCELRIKDVDFDQGLLVVHGGNGNKDGTTLLAEDTRGALAVSLGALSVIAEFSLTHFTRWQNRKNDRSRSMFFRA